AGAPSCSPISRVLGLACIALLRAAWYRSSERRLPRSRPRRQPPAAKNPPEVEAGHVPRNSCHSGTARGAHNPSRSLPPCCPSPPAEVANFSVERLKVRRSSENSKANRIETMKGPAESGQICSVGRRKIAKKIAKNKRCYANTLRPRSRMLLKVMKGGLVVLRQKTRRLFLLNLLTQYGHLGSILAIATIKRGCGVATVWEGGGGG